jgi:hypothetical protein
MRRFQVVLACSSVMVTISTGCRNDAPTEPPSVTGPSLMAASLRGDSLAAMRAVARGLAVSLADANIRSGVHAALSRSTAREKKLHLQRFLKARGANLGRAVGRRSAFGELGWTGAVSQLPDLEMYLPIPAQRAAWKGTNDILVAGFLETDEEIQKAGGMVTAYRTDGSSVQIAYNAVPKQPVIVIYPVETQFGTDGESPKASASGATALAASSIGGDLGPNIIFPPGPVPVPSACASNNPNGANLYICHTSISNPGQYEEFLRGGPELSMAMFSFVPPIPGGLVNPATRRLIACINEDQPGAQFYNQDSDTWDAKALLLSRAALQAELSSGRRVTMIVWEDDNGSKCDFNPEGNRVIAWGTVYQLSFISALVGIGSGGLGGWALASVSAIINGIAQMFGTSGDDVVGTIAIPSASAPLTNPKEIRGDSSKISGKVTFMTY